MQEQIVLWFPSALRARCLDEGRDLFPKETGGVLMGYWHSANVAVLTETIGPGPEAIHEVHSFEPDYEWQLSAISKHYRASGRRETYIGDWHTHPRAQTGYLSRADHRALRQIINTTSARTPMPLMAIFHGEGDSWTLAVWRARLESRSFFWKKLVTECIAVKPY